MKVEENGHTYYSLTERFRAVLKSERKNDQINYLKNAFSRFDAYTIPSRKKVSWRLNLGRTRKSNRI